MREALRILHVIRSAGFAGVERHVTVLARAQAGQGHSVGVIGGDPQRMASALQGAQVTTLPGQTMAQVLRSLAAAAGGADILHAHMTAAESAAAAASLGPAHARPLVSTRHFAARRGRSPLGKVATGLITWRVSAQIAISRFVADHVEGSPVVVHPGVAPAPSPQSPRQPAVLVAQRLEHEKSTDIALAAFAHSQLAERGWRLWIAGDGSLRQSLKQQAAELGIAPAAEFLGMRGDVLKLMTQASLLLAPCPIEGLGLGVLEAMSTGLPVVASRAGGHLETLPEEAHEFCFPAGDAGAAAAALSQLAEDPERRAVLGERARQRQQEYFTPEAQAAATEAVYRSALTPRPGRG